MKQKPERIIQGERQDMKQKPERIIQQEVRLAAPGLDYTLWRNQTGVAWQGTVIQHDHDKIILKKPRRITFGLTVGGSDLIGLRKVIVTQDMVGTAVAVFAALEVKVPKKKATSKQQNFLNRVAEAGGIAIVVRKPEDIPR